MKNPFQKVKGFIKKHAMLDRARGVLVAISGGPDSVALLDMLLRLSLGDRGWRLGVGDEQEPESTTIGLTSTQPLTPIPPLHVAHLDHLMRGRESAQDAEFVRALADRLGLRITIKSVDVYAAAEAARRGIEEIAREIRYDFLLAAATEAGCDRIAVGHTMTDQAETFLMRLIRGAGLRGLAAMRPVVPAHSFRQAREQKAEGGRQKAGDAGLPSAHCLLPSVSIVRPLLCITREEVEAYCRKRGLEFRTDATNLALNYTRNRVRHDVLTALRAINPQVVASISRAAENIAGDEDVLNGLASSLLAGARLINDFWGSPVVDGGITAYSVEVLLEQPAGMRRRMIIEAIRLARSALCEKRDDPGEVTSVHVAAVEALLEPKASGKHIALPGKFEVWREFDALVLKPVPPALTSSYESSISPACPDVEAGGFSLRLQRGLPAEMLQTVIEQTRREKQETGRDWMTVALDDCVLPVHLIIRPRLRGERACVVGQQRTIKLKNLMIDHRIPSSRRATWPLVTTPDGAYIWSPGLPPSLEFAAHDEIQSLAIMRASAI